MSNLSVRPRFLANADSTFLLANPATQEKACARPTVLSVLARAQEMKMRQTEKMYVMDVPTICLLTLQNDTTGTNQLPFRPDAKKHRLSADGGMGGGYLQ